MRTISYQIETEQDGFTVQQFLKKQGYSTRTVVKLKQYEQGMKLNGKHVRTVDPIRKGDLLEITFLDEAGGVSSFLRSNCKVGIVYEDDDLIVYNKPAGMPCHQSCGHAADTLANVFAAHCDKLGLDLTYRPLNRLDRDTTGAVVVAKNQYAAASVTGKFEKEYRAILCGVPTKRTGRIEQPIRREFPEEMRRIVAENGQNAITNYQVIAERGDYCLADFRLETGRTHQIRVHMAWLGCPLLGDPMYGTVSGLIARQALHCRKAAFRQPVTGEWIEAVCPLPADILEVCQKLGLSQESVL